MNNSLHYTHSYTLNPAYDRSNAEPASAIDIVTTRVLTVQLGL